jgi:hypothetical protein
MWETCGKGGECFFIIAASKEFIPNPITPLLSCGKVRSEDSKIGNLWINTDHYNRYVIRPAARVGGLNKLLAYFLRILPAI